MGAASSMRPDATIEHDTISDAGPSTDARPQPDLETVA